MILPLPNNCKSLLHHIPWAFHQSMSFFSLSIVVLKVVVKWLFSPCVKKYLNIWNTLEVRPLHISNYEHTQTLSSKDHENFSWGWNRNEGYDDLYEAYSCVRKTFAIGMEANKRNLFKLKDEINDEEILNMYQPYQHDLCDV